jgi:hypothetical protein
MRCLNCKYDLSHLTEHRCPECGREFDPKDPQTFGSPPNREAAIIWLSCLVCALPVIVWLLFELQRMPYMPHRPSMGTFLGGDEIVFVRGLITMFASVWVACVIALVVISYNRSASIPDR